MVYEHRFLIAFFITIAIETSALFFIFKFIFRDALIIQKTRRLLFAGFFGSFATLPYGWFVFPFLINVSRLSLIASEITAFVLEAFLYYFILSISLRKSFLVSLSCNAASFLFGNIILGLFKG